MPYTHFTAKQIHYLRQHYTELPPTHFAEQWGVGVGKVYELARRHGIKKRAPNGQPVWRKGGALPWAGGSRWV
jgi:hypothetical protein